jgi:ketosteroid isomerase-like protein
MLCGSFHSSKAGCRGFSRVSLDGKLFPRPGRATMVFSKDTDGWLCTHSHMSLNRGVPQASHANRPVKA